MLPSTWGSGESGKRSACFLYFWNIREHSCLWWEDVFRLLSNWVWSRRSGTPLWSVRVEPDLDTVKSWFSILLVNPYSYNLSLPIGWEQEEASWGIPPAEAERDLWPSNFLPSLFLRHSLKTALSTSWSVDLFSQDKDMERHGIIMTICYSLQIYLPPCSKCDKPLWPNCGPRRIESHGSSEIIHLVSKLHNE